MNIKTLFLATLLAVGLSAQAANNVTTVTQVTNTVTLSTATDYTITGTTPFSSSNSARVNITNTDHAVVILSKVKPSVCISNYLSKIRINGSPAKNGTNCQVKMYGEGCIIMPYASTLKPLTCYTGTNFTGTSYNNYTTGSDGGYMKTLNATSLNNQIRSFKLKRGYMVTFAIGTGGWGYSRCFVADKEDLEIAELPAVLSGKISSYRLFQWYDAQKKGSASSGDKATAAALNASWCYDWGEGNTSLLPDVEWVPNHIYEDWPSSGTIGSREGTCMTKNNNEPANSSDDHPQSVETVLDNWQNMMRTGLRLCSPATHDGGWNWHNEFMNEIDARGWRCDLVDFHAYWDGEWSSLDWRINTYAHSRPVVFSEWMWGASWNSNGIFGKGLDMSSFSTSNQQVMYNGAKPIFDKLVAEARVERFAVWNSENVASRVYYNGQLSQFGQYYANTNSGIGFSQAQQFTPTVVYRALSALNGNYDKNKKQITLSWTDPNGDMASEIRVEAKRPGSSQWTSVAQLTVQDQTAKAGVAYSVAVAAEETGVHFFRVCVVDCNGTTHYSGQANCTVSGGGSVIDKTDLLVNPRFDTGNTSGWTSDKGVFAYSGDTFPNSSCNTQSYNNNETFSKAIAAWVASSTHLGNEDFHQTVRNLPAGWYVFGCTMVAQHGNDMPQGVYLYASGASEEQVQCQHDATLWATLVAAGTTNQLMMHPEVGIQHAGGDLTVGLRLSNTNCNWVYADNFTLTYYSSESLFAGASEDNPMDATSLLVNPDFEWLNINGWDCTFVSGQTGTNVGYQGASYTNNGVTINHFIEAWANSPYNPQYSTRALGDGQLSQTLVDMPAGKYTLTVDCIAVNQDNKETYGVELFCREGTVEAVQTMATENGKPQHFEVTFICSGGDLTVGLRTRNTSANWIAADNFTLTYYGASTADPYEVILTDNIARFENRWPDMGQVYAEAAAKQGYSSALAAAKAATGDYETHIAALDAAVSVLEASISDYKLLPTAMSLCEQKAQVAQQLGFTNLIPMLNAQKTTIQTAYNNGTYDKAACEAASGSVMEVISEWMNRYAQPGDNVTLLLLTNPGFDTDFSGWQRTGANPAWGGMNIENTTGTGKKLSEINSGNAELYHAAFDISQTVLRMPKGLYTFSCQAFERDDNKKGVEAKLYAVVNGQEQSTLIKNLNEEGSSDILYQNGTSTWDSSLPNGPGGTYVPNTMCGANVYFAHGYYKNSLTITLSEPADLTVGIKTASAGDWVLFDDFQIVFEGGGASAWVTALTDLVNEVSAYRTANAAMCSANAADAIDLLLSNANTALQGRDADEMEAAFNALRSGYEDFQADVAYHQLLARRPAGWESASDTNPVDFTGMIKNADLNAGASSEWEWTKNSQNGPNYGGFNGTAGMEFWHPDAATMSFDYHQTLQALPAGTYELTVTAANSLNGQAPTGQGGAVVLYARSGSGFWLAERIDPVQVQDEACNEAQSVYHVFFTVPETPLDPSADVVVGVKTLGTPEARWFAADDFTLTYYGLESAKELSTPNGPVNTLADINIDGRSSISDLTRIIHRLLQSDNTDFLPKHIERVVEHVLDGQ